jgi:hypothetical protein
MSDQKNDLKEVLRLHALWLASDAAGARAYLSGADLSRANLSRADLSGADLSGANLSGAYLSDANHDDKTIWAEFQIVPEAGPFWLWKKLRNKVIAQLEVPAEAARVSSTGRKCRVEFARVLSLSDGEVGYSCHDENFEYRVGEIVRAKNWDPDFRVECSGGIHGFLRRAEVESY